MTTEEISAAIRSVLGEYASPEKIRELDAVLRPIYGAEAFSIANEQRKFFKKHGCFSAREQASAHIAEKIRLSFGVSSHD